MSAVLLEQSFVSYSEQRARLHAGLSRLWVLHHRLVAALERAIGKQDYRSAASAQRNIGRCETHVVRLELRISQLFCARERRREMAAASTAL